MAAIFVDVFKWWFIYRGWPDRTGKGPRNKPMVFREIKINLFSTQVIAVMVNEFSASASEIFAAAIQDYGRGVIIGSTSTYGKGTVQRNIGLDQDFLINTETWEQ